MYQKVTFYDNARLGNIYRCQFETEKSLDMFIEKWENANGCLNFHYDLWAESSIKYDLPLARNSEKWFDIIMTELYKGQNVNNS